MNEQEHRTPPQSFLLLKFGRRVYTKDGREGSFDFDESAADALTAEFNSRSRDLVIDFEHSTLSGNEAPAAGWIDRLLVQYFRTLWRAHHHSHSATLRGGQRN